MKWINWPSFVLGAFLICAFWSALVARSKNYPPYMAFLMGLIIGPLGVLAAYTIPVHYYDSQGGVIEVEYKRVKAPR